ncbi:hypothetical protein L1987_15518 [Smallanthus sonchifolius]|uniref:Uncharacterized protein n=1 Tax=Smallanthus sonchifolius TaxID=185202 RepID=A0ACB9J6A9_9ASTR|nr:hypothetical protein L1987_15518 [Smallanthus sonchifolius]
MRMDLDVDGFWTFHQFFSSNPLRLSATEQSLSPLWGFSDYNNINDRNDKPVENGSLASSVATHRLVSGYQDATCMIKERMLKALFYSREMSENHVLAQVWAPVKNKGRYVLTDQPFLLDIYCTGLLQYRTASRMYVFSLDGETDEVLELPGRVFKHKLPEWTPNVQYYSDKEYQRLNHALNYDVRGTLALPVFEPFGESCVGVLELVLTSQKINYAPEVDKVCKALEVGCPTCFFIYMLIIRGG